MMALNRDKFGKRIHIINHKVLGKVIKGQLFLLTPCCYHIEMKDMSIMT